ncbi:DUF3592 domain-containing protein [Propionibacteriaceae bacterium Y1685]|uniref:DUF3592 domain-containing protein n=1 Tax=Microlunatus sp. Y1700 TaxID=3418487 RepID=UPI003B81B5AF
MTNVAGPDRRPFGLGPAVIPFTVALLCVIGFGLPLVLVLGRSSATAWHSTTAEVVEIRTFTTSVPVEEGSQRRKKVTTHHTIVRYEVDGTEFVRTAHISGSRSYAVGEMIMVWYDPADPQEVRTAEPGSAVPWVLGGLGSGFVVLFGAAGLIMHRKGVAWPRGALPVTPAFVVPQRSTRPRAGRVVIIVSISATMGLLIAAGIIGGLELSRADWVTAQGTVTEVSKRTNDSGGESYAPVVTYTVDGREYVHRSAVHAQNPPEIGSRVQVRHDPDDPARATLVNLTWVAQLLFAIAVAVLIIGIVIRWYLRRGRTTS